MLIKGFGLSGSSPDSDDFVCQIESGLTEFYCMRFCIIIDFEKNIIVMLIGRYWVNLQLILEIFVYGYQCSFLDVDLCRFKK